MADKYGTDCGVKGMKNYLHIFIKGAFVLFLIAYLTVLYTSDSAKKCTHGTDCTDYGTEF